jgi:hypothetical protein
MFSGLILIIALGTVRVGGVEIIYERLLTGDRLEIFE